MPYNHVHFTTLLTQLTSHFEPFARVVSKWPHKNRVKHIEARWRIYASLNWVLICSDNGLSPVRRQAIIWTNAGILLIGPLGTNFREIVIGIQTFSLTKLHLKTSSAKWRLSCLGLNELSNHVTWGLQAITWTDVDLSSARSIDIHLKKEFYRIYLGHRSLDCVKHHTSTIWFIRPRGQWVYKQPFQLMTSINTDEPVQSRYLHW